MSIILSFNEALDIWQHLKVEGVGVPYQSHDWCRAWQRGFGEPGATKPVVVIGRERGTPVFLWPFGISDTGRVKTLSFLGDQHGNQNTGLWDKEFYKKVSSEDLKPLLKKVCQMLQVDLLQLRNVPTYWQGRPYPLVLETAQPSPSPVFAADLTADFETYFQETHSKSSRKNLLRKERHLRESADFSIEKCKGWSEVEEGFKAFFEQRQIRAEETGIPNAFAGLQGQKFLAPLLGVCPDCSTGEPASMNVWTLRAAGKIRATYLCVEDQGTVYAYSNSVAHDQMLPNSPGLVLMKHIVEDACQRSDIQRLDLGLGQERYKTAWTAPHTLVDCYWAATWKGQLFARKQQGMTRIKAAIRQSENLWPLVKRWRKLRAKAR